MKIANTHSKLNYFIEHELLVRGQLHINYTVSIFHSRFMISFKTDNMIFCSPEYYAVYCLNELVYNEDEIKNEIEVMIKHLEENNEYPRASIK